MVKVWRLCFVFLFGLSAKLSCCSFVFGICLRGVVKHQSSSKMFAGPKLGVVSLLYISAGRTRPLQSSVWTRWMTGWKPSRWASTRRTSPVLDTSAWTPSSTSVSGTDLSFKINNLQVDWLIWWLLGQVQTFYLPSAQVIKWGYSTTARTA